MGSQPGATTMPIESTRHGSRVAEDVAIQWLFPERRLTVSRVPQGSRIEVGRQPGCAIALPSTEVSRLHAEIRREGPLLIVRNLASRNGVFVRGQRIEEGPLTPGDVLRFGDWIGLILAEPPEPGDTSDFDLVAPGLYGGRTLRAALATLQRAATSDLPIVVEGETGTGKEWTARAIHQWSGRNGPFLAVNCAALPETLAEAELFGYRKGAFTGADRASPGYFRAADGGTLLLDEIVDLPLALQAKLLRVLEQREVTPIGEASPVPIDVRVVAAAQQSLQKAVADKRFRADVCARLEGLTVRLPPLRERVGDVLDLFRVKLREHGHHVTSLEWRLVERLCLYDWPFNVREVDLLARRMTVLHGEETLLRAAHLPERLQSVGRASTTPPAPAAPQLEPPHETQEDRDERDMARLLSGLRRHRGNVARAAADAQISRQRAYRLMGARPDVPWRGASEEDTGTPAAS
jgi:transcriptional regulator with AAA-type ATPase domain